MNSLRVVSNMVAAAFAVVATAASAANLTIGLATGWKTIDPTFFTQATDLKWGQT